METFEHREGVGTNKGSGGHPTHPVPSAVGYAEEFFKTFYEKYGHDFFLLATQRLTVYKFTVMCSYLCVEPQ